MPVVVVPLPLRSPRCKKERRWVTSEEGATVVERKLLKEVVFQTVQPSGRGCREEWSHTAVAGQRCESEWEVHKS